MTLEELEEKLQGWRKARSLEENSTAEAQMNCYAEELDEFKDAIGDMIVCLVNARAMGYHSNTINLLLDRIKSAAISAGVDIDECIDMAWNAIEHRVGLTRDTGKFTKWKDLEHAERLKVAESGQLINAPKHIVDECKSLCLAWEWLEIEAIEDATFNR